MKKNIKYLALILILSLIIPFCPSVNASADISPMPDFPYGQDSFYNVNSGSFALWQVHNSTHISYIQTYTPNNINSPDPIIIFNETWLSSNNKYYIDYNYIIDTWDINGLHIDGNTINNNIRVPQPKQDYVDDNVVYATLVFTTDNIWWTNSDGGGIYAYANYYTSGYADPTPTPIPQPIILSWLDYPNTNQFSFVFKYNNNFYGIRLNEYGGDSIIYYPSAYYIKTPADSKKHFLNTNNLVGVKTSSSSRTLKYHNAVYSDDSNEYYSTGINQYNLTSYVDNSLNEQQGVQTSYVGSWFWYVCFYYWNLSDIEIVATNHSININSTNNPSITSTPTPTAIPTAIPQPTDNPNPSPTTPPDTKVVEPSTHWWDGLVNPIKYIFVPSSDKMMRTYNTFADKFGVQKPTKFEFDANALLRPDNITWNFKHVSLDGNDNTVTQITLVDFQMIDSWLDSSPGQFIIGIVRAVFTLLMWGYLIYIFQKHIATINYTDAHTLIEQSRKGGDSDD